MLRFTKTTLKKIEALYQEAGYSIRYEKGQFQPGYCLLEHKKVVVINKFLNTESRINILMDLTDYLDFDDKKLSQVSIKFLKTYITKRVAEL